MDSSSSVVRLVGPEMETHASQRQAFTQRALIIRAQTSTPERAPPVSLTSDAIATGQTRLG